MRTEEKTAVKNSIGRMAFVLLSLLGQIGWLIFQVVKLNQYSTGISLFTSFLALLVVIRIYGMHSNAAMKMPWIILILAFPVLGLCLYLLLGRPGLTRNMQKRFERVDSELLPRLQKNPAVMQALEEKDMGIANQFRYVENYGGYPVCRNTDVTFYKEAEDGYAAQIEELAKAEKFIFMEYHAIEDDQAFEVLKKVLASKAAAGVDVRILYDDVGSVGFIDPDFIKRMEKSGVKCRVFNPLMPVLNMFMNNRDHRKITVIDGKVGFTGGYNLANEYFNITHPYGQWKDTGVRLVGDAVKSLTVSFLEMWNVMKKTDSDYDCYLSDSSYIAKQSGFIAPYADSPLDGESVGENVYLNLIKNAKDYIWFVTPYLIISDEMNRELTLAKKRGVDVRIITPGIPDKKMVYSLTRSYYAGLARDGVRIFEYTPGFNHSKQCVCDDEIAVVGTINLDYRSLYHHFENAVLMYDCAAVLDMKADFDEMFPICREMTDNYQRGRSRVLRIWQCVLRLFAPLM